jgi:hypothetical protein
MPLEFLRNGEVFPQTSVERLEDLGDSRLDTSFGVASTRDTTINGCMQTASVCEQMSMYDVEVARLNP